MSASAHLAPRWSLEDLAYYYGTDKSHDDHKYTDVYESLFGPLRLTTRNVTEIGIALGQGLQVWHDYFPHAHIWGVDVQPSCVAHARKLFAASPRAHMLRANSKSGRVDVAKLGLAPESMDVVIDDGDHFPPAMLSTLLAWWKYVRPGGLYVIEDLATGANANGQSYASKGRARAFPAGFAPLVHNATWLSAQRPEAAAILRDHDSFFVDPLVGHRAYAALLRAQRCCMLDRLSHNSHLLVIRKRPASRARKVSSSGRELRSMRHAGVRPLLSPAQLADDPQWVLGKLPSR